MFFYDVSSPCAYLAAERVDAVFPVAPRWQPIVFGVLIRDIGNVPWSLREETRAPGVREVERQGGRTAPGARPVER